MIIKKAFDRLFQIIKKTLVNDYYYSTNSFAQEGEDLILSRYFQNQSAGYYIDIGAHHPKRFSNTYVFYKRGWHGLNIDAMPGSMKSFNRYRKRDVNCEIGVSKKEADLTYYIFNEPALNTFSEEHALEWSKKPPYRIKKEVIVKTLPLKKILERNIPPNQKISFFSIDVEGLDIEVIESNDWDLFRPEIVLVEDHTVQDLESIFETIIYKKMISFDYKLISKCYYTLIFKDKRII